jgi:hypothetical protein
LLPPFLTRIGSFQVEREQVLEYLPVLNLTVDLQAFYHQNPTVYLTMAVGPVEEGKRGPLE